MLRAFKQPFDDVRVLIVGQDPYPTPGHPVGLSFSVAPDVRRLPPSLVNIFTQYSADLGYPVPASGDLTLWSERGVLRPTGCSPSSRASRARTAARAGGSDRAGHPTLAARKTGQETAPLVAILWGRDARTLVPLLAPASGASVGYIESAHPSPYSAKWRVLRLPSVQPG